MTRKVEDLAAELARLQRQIAQFGFDLHDEALQDVTALRNDLMQFRGQLDDSLAGSADRRKVVGRVDDFLARVSKLDADLRRLAVSGGRPAPPSGPLSTLLADTIEAQADAGTVELVLTQDLDLHPLTEDERVTIVRLVESALANVRQHNESANARVTVRSVDDALEVEVLDDGAGFDVAEARTRAARDDRLGLLGMEERMASIGGTFSVSSVPDGPTCVTIRLARPGPRSSKV